jgi:two-component system CheB/CheR fusion protein
MEAIETGVMVAEPAAFFVVGIGASAGGLDALERFFDNLPEHTGMAFVVVQHLSPDFKSMMDELLARHTRMPIDQVENGMRVEPDHVYLIPPKKEMIVSGGQLLLGERERQQELSLPIDVFFRSLARDCGQRAIGIVLSGGGSDGSRGARDIHDAGGLVLVQDVASAQFDGMPKTARDSGVADWVLAPADMPHVLIDHARSHPLRTGHARSDVAPRVEGIEAVYQMLQEQFGIDFTHYKPSTVTRRIERRLALAHSLDIEEYVQRLRDDRDELDVLYRDLLIGVTRFFRDERAFLILEQEVLPALLREESSDPLRIWVAGCATGEEAYSLAISIQELMLELNVERQVKIFATDVHSGSLERAARGIYQKDAVAKVSPERLERYFLRSGEAYQVVPELRQMIVFARHNVIKDAPFTRVDLVSCRNLLIYLQPSAQQNALALFHFALKRGGTLFLGPSESNGSLSREFDVIDKHWRIYRKRSDVRAQLEAPLPNATHSLPQLSLPLPAAGRYSLTQLLGTYDALLDELMPPSLLVSERGELIQSFNGASRLLQLRDGRQDLDIFDLVGADLRMVLIGGLKRALSEQRPIVFKGVRIGASGDDQAYRLTMRRVQNRSGGLRHVLITCEAMEAPVQPETPALGPPREFDLAQVSRDQLSSLEAELNHTRENLQAAIEELETSNEELQASNEELQASNEELQSTNEELQSVNEELYTVNSEYQRKIAELVELTNDMDNLLSSTEIGTIFLDKQLQIRRFTPQIAAAFSLVSHDVGRSIETFAHKLEHPELLDDLRNVLGGASPVERELRGVRGKSFFLRILPYRTKGSVEGVVLTLIDVSGLKAAEDALFHERYLLNSLLFSIPDAIYFKDASGRFIRANHAMAERLGVSEPRQLVGKAAHELPAREVATALDQADAEVLQSGTAQHYKLEQRVQPDAEPIWDLVTRLPLKSPEARVVGIIAIIRNVTEQKQAEEKIQEAVRRRDQFLAMLSHELRNPLGAIVSATTLLKAGDITTTATMHERLFDVLERQSQHMARLLDDLLEASRVTQNKIELRRSLLDLRANVREAADAVRSVFEARQMEFTLELAADELYVDADPTRLQQIQINLLTNAAKYTPVGGHVRLCLRREGDMASIAVRDDGAGIAPEMLESVFEMFVQSHRTLDRAAGGLGVGLTLARWLAAMHGGSLSAHSEGEGQGSEFTLRLPLSAAGPARSSPLEVERPRLARGTRLVVVEDNEDSCELLCALLSRAGYECHTAATGQSALTLIDRVRPDVAILDVGLPELDGYEVARRLRKHGAFNELILIALTGYGRASDRLTSAEAGFDAHLVKPVRANELLSVLSRLREPAPAAVSVSSAS